MNKAPLTPAQIRANALRWARAPGVSTGYYAWCIAAKLPATAHAYKTKVRVTQAICGAPLKGGIAFPSAEAKPCPICEKKAAEMAAMLARTPVKQREAASKLILH